MTQDKSKSGEEVRETVRAGYAAIAARISRSCRATAFRDDDLIRFLTIYSDHDATFGKK